MKRAYMIFCVLTMATVGVFPQSKVLDEADHLYDLGRHDEVKTFLLKELNHTTNRNDKFEMEWRIARATMEIGDEKEDQGLGKEALMEHFKEGVSWAEKAIATDANNPIGYFWKSANLGRWGEVKGILESLNMAKEMRGLLETSIALDPEFSLGWHVLGILYERVPGGISFGDKDFAVSMGRKAVDTHEKAVQSGKEEKIDYSFYIELAKHLDKRNWNQKKRKRNQDKIQVNFRSARDSFTKNCYYEASVTLKNMNDREEARQLLEWTIDKLESRRNTGFLEQSDLKDAREALAEVR